MAKKTTVKTTRVKGGTKLIGGSHKRGDALRKYRETKKRIAPFLRGTKHGRDVRSVEKWVSGSDSSLRVSERETTSP